MLFFKKLKSTICKITGITEDSSSAALEDILIEADFGVDLAARLTKESKYEDDILAALKGKLESILQPLVKDFEVDVSQKPYVIVLAGVNGCGKTTTVAKIAYILKNKGFSVDIAACDTFRVAATEQLSSWASKLNCGIFKSDTPKDPASVAFEAMQSTKSDVLLVDTAGRLQNNINLMNELSKIYRVIGKINNTAPHMNVLIMDATTGQNSIDQVKEFGKVHPISGIVISKMDGGAKGGTIVRIADEFKLPILGIGTGETERSFEKFSVERFLEDLKK
ncbi:MAG: signal recognition particle-docking protein FtsY [Holosporales bacterium]|jgi:fused signal recognition particle receptor|nr:signal recognition particle-docking protein FtsY [Holosporales bacterium]